MTLHAFQTGIAALIRRPPDNRGSLDDLLAGYDLSPTERSYLDQLAAHSELNKYADEQADQRWDFIYRNLHKLWDFVEPEVCADLWFNDFEPLAMRTSADLAGHTAMSRAFLHFLRTAAVARTALSENAPPYIWDLLAFIAAEKDVTVLDSPEPSSGTRHPRLRLLSLDYDILDLLSRDSLSLDPKNLQPLNSPLLLAVLCHDPLASARYFVLDKQLFSYLSTPNNIPPAPELEPGLALLGLS